MKCRQETLSETDIKDEAIKNIEQAAAEGLQKLEIFANIDSTKQAGDIVAEVGDGSSRMGRLSVFILDVLWSALPHRY